MATTAFSDLHGYLRVALGDTARVKNYAVDQLDAFLRFELLVDTSHAEVSAGSKTITPVLTATEKGLLVVSAAIAALSPKTIRAYRTKTLSVTREMGQHLAWLEGLKRTFELGGTGMALLGETDVQAYFRGPDRLEAEVLAEY